MFGLYLLAFVIGFVAGLVFIPLIESFDKDAPDL